MFTHRYFFLFFLFSQFYLPWSLFSLSVADLSLEEKVGQVLMVHFHGAEANEEAQSLIQDLHVGGIIYYSWANELSNPSQIQSLSQGLQRLAQRTPHAIPLLIATDQEGGRVSRLKQGFTVFPGNYALGQTGEWQWGEESAWMMGQELKAVGISLNLAPSVDVYTQPANPVIGIRAFSSDPKLVARWGSYTLQGYKRAGVIATLKHFPGHGDVQVDSHEALPIVAKKREELEQVELYPFRSLASQADAILTAHLLVPALDAQHCVTFSKKIVTDLLRNDFHFQGIIMTDSLAMEGALKQYPSIEEVVLKSFEAGHDIILLGGKQLLASQSGLEFTLEDVKRVHRYLVSAVRQGQLSEQRLNESVGRILVLKEKYRLFDFAPLTPALLKANVLTVAHCTLAKNIAQRAMRVEKGQPLIPQSIVSSSVCIIAPDCLRDEITQTSWNSLGSQAQIFYFEGLNPGPEIIQKIQLAAEKSQKCIYFAYNAWQFAGQQDLFKTLKKGSSFTVAIATRDPLDVQALDAADIVLCTFSPVAYSLQAAFDILTAKNGISKSQ
jgi:beta-N-acetylhexosaminidase